MAIRFYDNALVAKIKSWVRDDKLTITSPDETRRYFAYIADETNDKPISLPLVAIRRARDVDIKNTHKQTLTFNGHKIHAHHITNDKDQLVQCKVKTLNAIPISLSYQIDIYTRYAAECDEYLRNFIFNIVNFPKLEIEIPYQGESLKHTCAMDLITTMQDNSDIPERLVPGQFTRWSIGLRIDDAYLFSIPIKDTYHIEEPQIMIDTASSIIE